MRRMLATACLLAGGLAVLPAHAATDGVHAKGGCLFFASNLGVNDVWAAVVVWDDKDATVNPVQAVVTCTFYADGGQFTQFHYTGAGVVAGTSHLGYDGEHADKMCTDIEYTNVAAPPVSFCDDASDPLDQADALVQRVFDATATADPYLCPELAALSPGPDLLGNFSIEPTGDTWVFGTKVWDCPPYDS